MGSTRLQHVLGVIWSQWPPFYDSKFRLSPGCSKKSWPKQQKLQTKHLEFIWFHLIFVWFSGLFGANKTSTKKILPWGSRSSCRLFSSSTVVLRPLENVTAWTELYKELDRSLGEKKWCTKYIQTRMNQRNHRCESCRRLVSLVCSLVTSQRCYRWLYSSILGYTPESSHENSTMEFSHAKLEAMSLKF